MRSSRESILREMGLGPIWRLRGSPGEASPPALEGAHPIDEAPHPVPVVSAPAVLERPAAKPPRRSRIAETPPAPEPASGRVAQQDEQLDRPRPQPGAMDWSTLEQTIRDCRACSLCERRTMAVPGVGDRKAEWLLVGEGPGAEEDRKGEPFVGQAGRLLDAMLASIGLSREHGIFIANAVKCRPPGNRTPAAEELAACFPYLERQIELLQPRLIIALGRPAAQVLLDREIRISAVRGEAHAYKGIPLLVTYHPAYLLRNQNDKAKAWADLCLARRLVPPGHLPTGDRYSG